MKKKITSRDYFSRPKNVQRVFFLCLPPPIGSVVQAIRFKASVYRRQSHNPQWVGSGLNFTVSLQMSSLIFSSVKDGCSKSKQKGLEQTGSSLISWRGAKYGWYKASSTAKQARYKNYFQWNLWGKILSEWVKHVISTQSIVLGSRVSALCKQLSYVWYTSYFVVKPLGPITT